MASQYSCKRNRRSGNAKARRRRVLGLGTSFGAFLAATTIPLVSAPTANADEFDLIIDNIIDQLSGSFAGVDPVADLGSSSLDAAAASDLAVQFDR